MPELTPDTINKLVAAASSAMTRAYAPYSNFHVGAAILCENNIIYTGCNVENAAYPVGSCAEASAISAMINGSQTRIVAIAVTGAGSELCTPCGGCRQRIREFAQPSTPVLICSPEKLEHQTTLDALLPLSFGPENLNSQAETG